MGALAKRAKDRRSFRLECLEDRNLLSAIKHPGIVAEVRTAAGPVQIHLLQGHVQGMSAPEGLYGGTLPGYQSYSGHGTANTVGNVYFGSQQLESSTPPSNSVVSISQGSGLLTTFRGAKIYLAYTGTGVAPNRTSLGFGLNGTVTGGTGRFTGVTGDFHATGVVQRGQGKFHLNFTMNLTYPTTG